MGIFIVWCVYFLGDGHRVLSFLRSQASLRDDWRSSEAIWETTPRTVAEIAGAIRFSEWRVRLCLRQLQRDDLVESDNASRWRIVLVH